jgi:hypothetical protein
MHSSSPELTGVRPSVILVREWEQQLSSSGCCGRIEGDFLSKPGGQPSFPERRAAVEAMGPLYRGLRERYGDTIDLQVADPRSFITLIPLLVRDFRRHRVGLRTAIRTLTRTPVTGVIVNGELIATGAWPPLEDVAEAIGTPGATS